MDIKELINQETKRVESLKERKKLVVKQKKDVVIDILTKLAPTFDFLNETYNYKSGAQNQVVTSTELTTEPFELETTKIYNGATSFCIMNKHFGISVSEDLTFEITYGNHQIGHQKFNSVEKFTEHLAKDVVAMLDADFNKLSTK